jgi:molybdopterin molybdotransferase
VHEMISLEQAQEIILDKVKPVDEETIGLSSALGRVLSRDIYAPVSLPPFPRSPLDGYVVRAADIALASPDKPVKLQVEQEIPAGNCSGKAIAPNQTARIMTGAPIPPGADVVIRFEDVRVSGKKIQVFYPMPAYTNICFTGEDICQGEMVLPGGTVLSPAGVGVLAGLGLNEVPVFKVMRVAVVSTGNELIDISENLRPGKIFNSNLYVLAAEVKHVGSCPVYGGIAPDTVELTAFKINEMLAGADMVLTTGGVSVGDYDFVEDALVRVGANILFHRIGIRPGTPTLCAVKEGKLIIGLSGNPAAAFIVYHLLAKPAILKMSGLNNWRPIRCTGLIQDDFLKASGQRRFLQGHLFLEQDTVKVRLSGRQRPGSMRSTLNCNALIDIPPNSGPLKIGDKVDIILLSPKI